MSWAGLRQETRRALGSSAKYSPVLPIKSLLPSAGLWLPSWLRELLLHPMGGGAAHLATLRGFLRREMPREDTQSREFWPEAPRRPVPGRSHADRRSPPTCQQQRQPAACGTARACGEGAVTSPAQEPSSAGGCHPPRRSLAMVSTQQKVVSSALARKVLQQPRQSCQGNMQPCRSGAAGSARAFPGVGWQ